MKTFVSMRYYLGRLEFHLQFHDMIVKMMVKNQYYSFYQKVNIGGYEIEMDQL